MEQKKQNGLGTAGMIIGIFALLFSCILIGGFIGIVGLIISIVAVTMTEKKKGNAIAGIVLNGISILILLFIFIGVMSYDTEESSNVSKIEDTKTASSKEEIKEEKIEEVKQAEEKVEIEKEEKVKEEKKTSKSLATVGEYVENKDWKISLLEAREYDSIDSDYYSDKPEIEGNKFVVLFFEVENVSNEDNHFNMFYYESYIDGYSADTELLMNDPENYKMLSGDVAAGKKMKGYVAYEVTPDWQEIEFSYKDWVGTSDKVATFLIKPENITK